MALSPLLLVAIDRWVLPRHAARTAATPAPLNTPQDAPVILAGFGRYGQIIGRMLYANQLRVTVLDHDADQVAVVRRFGFRVHYGDATRLDLLRMAGAESARVLVIAIDDVEQSLKLVDLARQHFPHLAVVARARNVAHYYRLRERGVTLIERETLDSALMSARSVLELLGWHPHHARRLALRFRAHSVEQLERMLPHAGNPAQLISMAKEGRQQLEELFGEEQAEVQNRRAQGWGESPPP
jgi:glutathione-regulated potassium-efflux system ancillary protein KefC